METLPIVVLGGSDGERAALVSQLAASGLHATSADQLRLTADALPGLLVITGPDAAQLVAEARDVALLAGVPILAVVPAIPPNAAAEALAAGATDVAFPPVPAAVLAARSRNLLRLGRAADPSPLPSALIRVNDALSQPGDDAAALVQVLEIATAALGFDRASLVAHVEGSEHAFVVAATDAPTRAQFRIDVHQYPEIAQAIRTGDAVLVDDTLADPLTAPVAGKLAQRGVRAIGVFPVLWRGRALGVMLLRRAAPGTGHVGARGVELARLITTITAAHLRHGPVLETLREQLGRLSRVSYEAERRLRGIDSLKEHFEAGADGVVVLDDGGRVLFVNAVAERITGFGRDGLLGGELADLVAPEQRGLISDAVSRVLAGANGPPFDLRLATTSGAPIYVSVSTSTVLADSGAVILTFRDVTAERALAHDLRSTTEFLERLIDSTVDAIIAADMRGRIILFNQGAERLFGYHSEAVIGKRGVWELYESDGARQLMRMLRSTSHGGVGRLEQTRREIRDAGGLAVPVSMTASILYEGGREVATVGILTDLRERIRMEQRLLDAQQKLQLSEKQALVAELAGAAAHELNQPLTSIMGYAQLIERQSAADAPHRRAVGIILSEAERMAGIVKKVGRITKYETTDYVGSARMLDLDRAAGEPRPSSSPGIITPRSAPPAAADHDAGPRPAADDRGEFEELTGEFTAVAPAFHDRPGLRELMDLEDPPAAPPPPREREEGR